jgi:hypothetical protein
MMIAGRVFSTSAHDALVAAAAVVHAAVVAVILAVAAGGAPGPGVRVGLAVLLAVAMSWGANTVSHIHLHAPIFRAAAANRAFSLFLSVLLAVPQSWWKLRHLEHHGLLMGRERERSGGLRARGVVELAAWLACIALFAAHAPLALATVYVPGIAFGLLLCANQGRQEHRAAAAGVDVRARLYNRLWFNDGFHAAHHRFPEAHWTTLPARVAADDAVSSLPPILRMLEEVRALANAVAAAIIDALERGTLHISAVRRYLLETHARSWRQLLSPADIAAIREVTIIGGGLYPRTALVLARLLPDARLTLVDAVPAHLDRARAFLEPLTRTTPSRVRLRVGVFDPAVASSGADLLVVPLAFRGRRARFYSAPPAPRVAVHDWIWRARGDRGVAVSLLLLKRLNLRIGLSSGRQVDAFFK